MALLERVATLLRANVNDLIDKAEKPAVMLKQLVRDMENQLLQVKTQVAIAVADQHVLEAKCTEHADAATAWRRKAELALAREDDTLARAAAERSLQAEQMLAAYSRQLADQRVESDLLRQQYRRLEAKLAETSSQGELLLEAHRRLSRRVAGKDPAPAQPVLGRMRDAVLQANASRTAERQTEAELGTSAEDQLRQLELTEQVDALLADLRRKPRALEG